MLEGVLTVTVDGVRTVMNPGDSIHIAPLAYHSWKNETDRTVRVLAVHRRAQDQPLP